jgi:oxygen-independent coproporphyrinogen-3 oxidase
LAGEPALITPPLSVYLHFPWCVRKCPYCDFNSFTLHGELPAAGYVQALQADIAAQVQSNGLGDRRVHSVFLGGGTPSLFTPDEIGSVLAFLRTQLPLTADAEITLEANPATVERGRFAEYRAAGITRVSLGAQSFDADILQVLGRIHTPADVYRAAEELHACGLDNFNLDLMFALPGQLRAGALADLRAGLALQPAHLSHYQLTLEPGTEFAALPPPGIPEDELAWDMQQDCHDELAAQGFEHYEISGFARPGRRCAHNLNYWQFGDYLGAGAGAHGKLTDPLTGQIVRTTQQREPRRYQAQPVAGLTRRTVPAADLPFEFALNALRLLQGFEFDLYVERTGLPGALLLPPLQALAGRGLLQQQGSRWQASALGLRFLNDVIESFLPASNSPSAATV